MAPMHPPITVVHIPHASQRIPSACRPAIRPKSPRGEYAVDDAAMHRWFAERAAAGRWPPTDPQQELSMSMRDDAPIDDTGVADD
jgi:hypothetical protein